MLTSGTRDTAHTVRRIIHVIIATLTFQNKTPFLLISIPKKKTKHTPRTNRNNDATDNIA